MQLKLKNSIDVCIFDELTFASLTDDEITGEENLTIQSEVFNQEERFDDKVQEANIDEEEGEELNLSAESKDDNENGNKTQRPGGQDDNRTTTRPNYTLKPNAEPIEDEGAGVCEQEDHQGALLNMARRADDISHPCSSSGVSSKNTEVTIIINNDLTNGGNEARHQGKESEMPQVAILSNRLEKTNTDTTLDKCTSSQQYNTRQINPASAENTNEGKKRPVVSTLAVPSIKYSRVSKRKDLPSPPACKEIEGKDTLETDLIATNMETTEVKITVHPDDEQLDNNNDDDDDDDDDGDVSAEDLLCFSWQIAQGMVSTQPKRAVREKILQKKK